MCRGFSTYFSMYTSPTPKAASASRCAVFSALLSSFRSRMTRMPRPPPPATALTMTGSPRSFAIFSAFSSLSTGPSLPGRIGTPAFFIARRARALSPSTRLAIRIFLNMSGGLDGEQPFAVLRRLAVLHVRAHDFSLVLGRDLIHQLHRLDDAETLTLLLPLADLDEGGRAGLGTAVESADDRGFDHGQLDRLRLVVRNGVRRSVGRRRSR